MLRTGKELIADLVKVTGTGYVVKNPLVVHVLRGPDGQGSLAFAPWSMVHKAGQEVPLFDTALSCQPVEVIDEVADSYIQQTTGIIMSSRQMPSILMG
jgi:hypothetical protein